MWIGSFEDFNECLLLAEELKNLVVAFIKNNDMQNLPNGRYELNGENYVNVFEYDTKENDGVFEAHKQYIDVHYAIMGEEKILWGESYTQELKPYQADGDYSLGKVGNPKEINEQGKICVFMPNEPHKAGVIYHGEIKVKKAVFKLKFWGK